MKHQQGMAMFFLIISIIIEFTILCCREVARRVPTNYILLAMFTYCQAFVFAQITTAYQGESVLMAAGMTAGMTAGITGYAMTTKRDFTVCSSLFVTLSIGLLCLFFCSIFMSFATWWHPLVSAILVVVYGLYLIFDTQLIAGGHQYSLCYDDYILGALLIYVDIMALFLELLKLLGDKR